MRSILSLTPRFSRLTPELSPQVLGHTEPTAGRATYPSLAQATLLAILFAYSGGAVALVLLKNLSGEHAEILSILCGNLMGAAVAVALGLAQARRPVREVLPFRAVPALLFVPLTVAVLGWIPVGMALQNLWFSAFPPPADMVALFSRQVEAPYLGALVAVVMAPLTEELVFRGVILTGLLLRYSFPSAVVASAILFALGHGNPYQLIPSLAMGLLLGWLCARTRSLWPGLYGHALNNAMAFLYISRFQERADSPWLALPGAALLATGIVLCHRELGRSAARRG